MTRSVDLTKQTQAIELLAEGGKTYIEIATILDISTETLRTWRKDPRFQDQVKQRCRELLREREPELYSLAFLAAQRNLSHQHIKLLLDRIERLEDIAEGRDRDNTLIVKWREE